MRDLELLRRPPTERTVTTTEALTIIQGKITDFVSAIPSDRDGHLHRNRLFSIFADRDYVHLGENRWLPRDEALLTGLYAMQEFGLDQSNFKDYTQPTEGSPVSETIFPSSTHPEIEFLRYKHYSDIKPDSVEKIQWFVRKTYKTE